ncbi:protein abrupt-like [Eriocheir sinensis]|uniref:protein abrupt-like n=1 Tax=Eriocheir sinensis TaxID=95602 RepID=UPI0021C5C02C|nr:protein abrupt-like [Eriocheir sinensis]XP_050719045.1 protein abrupt-like [Eriocheir sinensis]
MESDLLALHWMEHASVFSHAIGNLRTKNSYTDATLACEGHFYPVHKFVLSTCSQYFNAIFEWTPCINPVVVINNVTCKELEALLDFMYMGEVSVKESLIPDVMRAAECLRIRGLSIVDDENTKPYLKSKNKSDIGGPPRKRKRTSSSKKKCTAAGSDKIKACDRFESNGHLSPPPASISGNKYSNEGEMNHTEDHVPDLTSAHHSQRNPTETENQTSDLPNILAPNNTPSNFLQAHTSSSPQPHLTDQAGKSVPPPSKPNINQHSHNSPPHRPTQSHPCALDLSSHEHTSKVSMNTAVEVIKSGKMEIKQTKPSVQQPHNVVSSEEIPDLLDSLVDMRPLYDTKTEPEDEVATLHAVEPNDNLYEFSEEMPSVSAASSQQEVRLPKGPAASGSSKKKDQHSMEENPALKCSVCNKQFQKKDSLTRHMRTHNKEPYTCNQCSFISPSYRASLDHKKKEHGTPHKCTLCDFATQRPYSLKRHMAHHDKPHQCPECKFRASTLNLLEKHMKKMHEKK